MSIYSMLIVLFSSYCFVYLKPFDDHMIKGYNYRLPVPFGNSIRIQNDEKRSKFCDYCYNGGTCTSRGCVCPILYSGVKCELREISEFEIQSTTVKTATTINTAENRKENQNQNTTILFIVCVCGILFGLFSFIAIICFIKRKRRSRLRLTKLSAPPKKQTARPKRQLKRPIALQSQRVVTNHNENTASNNVRETQSTANHIVEASNERSPSNTEVMTQSYSSSMRKTKIRHIHSFL